MSNPPIVKNENHGRFFAGVELDRQTRGACADVSSRIKATGFSATFEAPEKLHITLAFLGNVGVERIGEIGDALRNAASAISSFDLTLDRIGAFPHERNPRVVYIGARQQGAAFRNAAETIRAAFATMDFAFPEDAVAHVTIARVKGGADRPVPAVEVAPIPVAVTEVVLFESIFDPRVRTSRYEIAERCPL
jgi:RNA 2',3'-cyclic 3'-phosphodiesterase